MESFYAKVRHFIIPEESSESEAENDTEPSDPTKPERYRFECLYCFDVFTTNEDLISHKRTHHISKQYTCKWCNVAFTYTGWEYHYKKHTNDKRYSCNSCDKKFYVLQQLRSHMAHHKYQCTFCDQTFVTMKRFRSHSKSVHNIDESVPVTPTLVQKRRKRLGKKQKTTKPEVLRKGIMQRKLPETGNQRKRQSEDTKSFVSGKGISKQRKLPVIDLRRSPAKHTKSFLCCNDKKMPRNLYGNDIRARRTGISKSFVCNSCDLKFPSIILLRDHIKRHLNCRPYWCNDCTAKFILKKELEKHVRKHLYKCEVCSKCFSYKHYLDVHCYNEHMQSVDFDPKPETGFRCRYCGSTYFTEEELQNHIRFSGENLIICARCFDIFDAEQDFEYHLKTVHKIECNSNRIEYF